MRVIILFLSSSFIFTTIIFAAGFDCRKASTDSERLICKSKRLSELDSWLNRVYHMSIWHTNKLAILKAKKEQQNWLVSVRDRCKDEMCLENTYLTRIEEVSSVKTHSIEGEYVGITAEFSRQETDFRKSLIYNGISILTCPLMIKYIDRTYTTGRDDSYGAFCLSKDDKIIMVCDDTMIGKLTFNSSSFEVNTSTLLDFTKKNCPPGG